MKSWQLIAHHDDGLRSLIRKEAQKALAQLAAPVAFVQAENIAVAREDVNQFGADRLNLVIVGSAMPKDDGESIGMSGREGTMQFIKELKQKTPGLPIIVIANTPDDRLVGFLEGFDKTAIVAVDGSFNASLAIRIAMLYSNGRPSPGARIQLDISITGGANGTYLLRGTGSHPFETPGALFLDSSQLRNVIDGSRRLGEDVEQKRAGRWQEDLKRLSFDLRRLLFRTTDCNIDCWDEFVKHRERVGGIASSRVRVTVGEETHPMLIEALSDNEAGEAKYWMLNAPVFRRFAQKTTAFPPLFKDQASRTGPINGLIIEADVRAGSVGNLSFAELRQIRSETASIKKVMAAASQGGVVERCRWAP